MNKIIVEYYEKTNDDTNKKGYRFTNCVGSYSCIQLDARLKYQNLIARAKRLGNFYKEHTHACAFRIYRGHMRDIPEPQAYITDYINL